MYRCLKVVPKIGIAELVVNNVMVLIAVLPAEIILLDLRSCFSTTSSATAEGMPLTAAV